MKMASVDVIWLPIEQYIQMQLRRWCGYPARLGCLQEKFQIGANDVKMHAGESPPKYDASLKAVPGTGLHTAPNRYYYKQ